MMGLAGTPRYASINNHLGIGRLISVLDMISFVLRQILDSSHLLFFLVDFAFPHIFIFSQISSKYDLNLLRRTKPEG
jgi:hypothetical protein